MTALPELQEFLERVVPGSRVVAEQWAPLTGGSMGGVFEEPSRDRTLAGGTTMALNPG